MLSVSGLATNATLTAVKNKIPDISILVKKNQITTQKYYALNINVLLKLITINILKILLL